MKPIFNRAPLTPNSRAALSLGHIEPEGWLKEQLRAQADGLSGKLFDIWPDVGENCGWLGGNGDAWERAPYYLDGLVPLAWLLGDERLKQICLRYIEWILASQREDGFFGPASNEDWWPRMVVLKALIQYFQATLDKRVLVFMDKYFQYQKKMLDAKPLRDWAVARGGENMQAVIWLYNITGQKYLLDLLSKLRQQTLDWPNHFHTFPQTRPMSASNPWYGLQKARAQEMEQEALEGIHRPLYSTLYHYSHGVNVAMGLKTPALISLFKAGFKEQGGFRFGWEKLMKYHGVAYGMFTCDEHLNGASPTQGTELCSVVELMYSLESMLEAGDFSEEIPDILEKLAFNALPAMFTADMRDHQYLQQANQVKVSREPRDWYNNGDDASLFGFAPHFACCTANYHQGFPKFATHLWYATNEDGLYCASYAPCTVRHVIGNVPVRLRVDTEYPFEQTVRIEVSVKQPIEFSLSLRIPQWANAPMVYLPGGEIMQVRAGETAFVRRRWRTGDVVKLELPMEPRITRWHHQSAAVELGPLLMALQPREAWHALENGDWAIDAASPWNYAIAKDEPMKAVFHPGRAHAFKHGEPPVELFVKAARLDDWQMDGASCAAPPILPSVPASQLETIALVPYGYTSLRVSQFPYASVENDNG